MASGHLGTALRQIHRLFEAGTAAGLTDGQLIDRFLIARDEAAFTALVGRHGPMVLAVCRAVLKDSPEVEDAFQATFLILLRKAGTIWRPDAVGGWLHRVAHRVALEICLSRARTNSLTIPVNDPSTLASCETDPCAEDWRAGLHEEVERLPEKLRVPVVLCYLEGKTHAQVACELRSSEATIRRRLAQARDLLRCRLTRRGTVLSLSALSAALAREASAAVPIGWVEALSRFAGRLSAGEAAVRGGISAATVGLAETLARSLVIRQIRTLAALVALLVAAGLVAPHLVPAARATAGPGGGSIRSTQVVDSSPNEPPSAPPQVAVMNPPERLLTVRGRVLDPDGQPFAGAKIYSYTPSPPRGYDCLSIPTPAACATSGADGQFECQIGDPRLQPAESQSAGTDRVVVALARGFGPGWTSITEKSGAKDLTLTLVRDDVPITGRVIDLEGRPISAVAVRPVMLMAYPGDDLSAWEAAIARSNDISNNEAVRLPSRSLELFRWRDERTVRTDAEGRFRLAGLGRERVVLLWIDGPTIVTSFVDVNARTRPGPTFHLSSPNKPEFGTEVFHGATFDHVAAPTRPIEGFVRDKITGKPLAGISIQSNRFAGNVISGRAFVRATTDALGRYRLVGMPGGHGNAITANPGPGQPYLGTGAEIPPGTAPEPAVVDFALKRGVAIRGKVIDKATGTPVPAVVEYFLFADNPHRAEIGQLHNGEVTTGPDGSFELVGLPGRGLVTARAAQDHYLVGQGAATIPGADEQGWFRTDPHICEPGLCHTIKLIDPAEGTDSLRCELALDRGKSREGTVIDPDGKPLAGCVAVNLCPATMSQHVDTLSSEAFTAIALDPKQARPLFFRHHSRNLAGVVMTKGDDPGPLRARLQPAGTVIGRLLDEEGRPAKRVVISVSYQAGQFAIPYYFTLLDPVLGNDGRFRIEGLIPGVTYNVDARVGDTLKVGEFAKALVLKPRETRDLGDVTVRPR